MNPTTPHEESVELQFAVLPMKTIERLEKQANRLGVPVEELAEVWMEGREAFEALGARWFTPLRQRKR